MPNMSLQAVAWLLSAMAGLQWVCLKIDLVYHEAAVFHSHKVLSKQLRKIKKDGPAYLEKNVKEMEGEMVIATTLGMTADISRVYKEAKEARKKVTKVSQLPFVLLVSKRNKHKRHQLSPLTTLCTLTYFVFKIKSYRNPTLDTP